MVERLALLANKPFPTRTPVAFSIGSVRQVMFRRPSIGVVQRETRAMVSSRAACVTEPQPPSAGVIVAQHNTKGLRKA